MKVIVIIIYIWKTGHIRRKWDINVKNNTQISKLKVNIPSLTPKNHIPQRHSQCEIEFQRHSIWNWETFNLKWDI